MPAGRRGRAPEQQHDPTAAYGRTFTPLVRLGWLMRAWRMASGQVYGAQFAADLRSAGIAADASQVSRWENGARSPALSVVGAYEELTAAPPGSIQAAMLGAARLPGALVADPAAALDGLRFDGESLPDLLDELLTESALGAQWLRLGCQVGAHPDRFTMRRSTWRGLTTRLVAQIGRSVGSAWSTRYESAMLLSRHPHGQAALVETVEALVDEPGTTMAVDHISLLQDATGDVVNGLVLRLLDAPPGPVFSGALWVTGAKITRGHIAGADLERFEEHILRRMVELDGATGNPFVAFADVLANLPLDSRRRLAQRAPQLARVLGATVDAPARPLGARPVGVVKDVTRGLGDDPLLTRLVDEALSHPDNERRNQSCITLMASPLRTPLSDNICRVIEQHLPDRRATPLLTRLAVLMSFVNRGLPRHDEVLTRVASTDSPAAPFAVFALAHSSGVTSTLDPVAMLAPPSSAIPSAPALYYAGMRAHPALAQIAASSAYPEPVRGAARWWLQAGPAIHED